MRTVAVTVVLELSQGGIPELPILRITKETKCIVLTLFPCRSHTVLLDIK